MLHLLLHLGHLLESRDVALASVELRREEDRDELARDRRADDLGAEAEDVHVVVLDRLVGAVHVVADRGANAGELAGGNSGAGAGAADEDAALGLARLDPLAELARLVGIVDPHLGRVRAQIDRLVPPERLEHRLAECDTAMVERDRTLHPPPPRARQAAEVHPIPGRPPAPGGVPSRRPRLLTISTKW